MARGTELTVVEQVLGDDPATEPVVDNDFLPAEGMSFPFSKEQSHYWKKRVEDTKASYEIIHKKWDKIFELYQKSGNEGIELEDVYPYHLETDVDENIVRNNIRTLMRTTYMQNPHIEFTDMLEGAQAEVLEHIISYLMGKQTYPGLNMKAKARRWIMHGQMTNFGILRLDYQSLEGSRQEAVITLQELEQKLPNAKKKEEVEELYREINILHERLPLAQGKGMGLSIVMPHKLIVDPNCTMLDFSDADWLAEEFDMDRIYMETKYYFKDEDGKLRLRANPKHTRRPHDDPGADVKKTVIDTVLNNKPEAQRELTDKDTVRCYYVYDRLLRRIYTFCSENWDHPLWAEDDDLGLSRFFRHFAIAFGEPIETIIQPGEASFYIGMANEINRVNREAKRIRDSVFNTIVYNKKSVDGKEVAKLVRHLKSPRQVAAFGVSTDPDKKIGENLEILAPPSAQYQQVFDTALLRQSIDRATNLSEIERGQQFKTNTTNGQVEYYENNRQQTTGVLVDTIEDSFEALGWSMAEILVSKYSKQDIIELVGETWAEKFTPMNVKEFNQQYRMKIAAGSIEKPTTEFKKRESLQVAGAIGQLGQAAPGSTLKMILRMFQNAFSGFVVKKAEWDQFDQEITANMQKGVSTNGQGN